ncbi:phosphotransferase family protein [Pseudonocardia pini]|uniref:phosphotransferase family protein n=1 Tax=Pseudonocardia pini TaxID=2758030 RepID=UPI001C689EA1|nr:phosphotransferase family protein [Pseudonocardia pini]
MTVTDAGEEATTGLSGELRSWIEQCAGARLVAADRRPGGGRHEAWTVDVESADGGVRPLFLRYDRSDPADTGDPFTLHREAAFYRALQGTAVPVPEILGVHPTEQAVLSTRVPGETWFSRLKDEGLRHSVASDFMRILAALHAVDPHRLAVSGQDPDASLSELLSREIDTWEALYRHGDTPPHALVEFGFAWLRRHAPQTDDAPVIVQGDTGPGNFLYGDGRVTAVLDWELAHLGDPHDDLGWLALRAVQEPFTDLAARIADYEAASGRRVDYDRLRYYRVFAELRVVVLSYRGRLEQNLLGEVGNALIYGALHDRLLVEALADALGVEPEAPPELSGEPTDRTWVYDAALAQIREVIVPRSTDPFAVLRSKGLARLLKYLQQADVYAPAAEAQELDDLATLLGTRPATLAEGRRLFAEAVVAGTLEEQAALRQFSRDVARRTRLVRPAMGALADRHFDPLPRR